jgi:hypothetical protein
LAVDELADGAHGVFLSQCLRSGNGTLGQLLSDES